MDRTGNAWGTEALPVLSWLAPAFLLAPPWAWVLAFLYFLVVFVGNGIPVVLAYQMPSLHLEDVGVPSRWGKVSVIIPARNEEPDLRVLLDDLERQDYAPRGGTLEILVVDGGSTDGTRKIAVAHPAGALVLDEPPLPEGWVGKSWACHTGAKRASGDLLLFLDADVRLAPSAVRATVAEQERSKATLVSFAARVVMVGFWENVVLPLYVQFVLLYFVTPRANRPHSRRAMANGQFIFVTREGYERAGGHERIRGDVLEDVRLAQEVKRSGGTLRVVWTPELLTTRMYSDRHEMYEGISKNLHGFRFSAARQLAFFVGILLLFLSPFAVLAFAVLLWHSLLWTIVAAALIGTTLLKQAGYQHALGASLPYALTYPLGCVFYLAMLLTNFRHGLADGKVMWKGRSYSMQGGPTDLPK